MGGMDLPGLGLKNLVAAAASVPSLEYAVLLLIIGLVWIYNALEFHFVGDALKAWRGDAVQLIHSPKSKIASELLPKCQTLNKRYSATPWLASPHLQTLFLHFFGRSPRVEYQRQLYITPDGGTIALDWIHPPSGQGTVSDETPTIITVPGLTSDSRDHYVRHLVKGLSDSGWRVVVINHRGLGGVSITSDHLYNAGWTEDLRKLIPYVHQKYPKAPLLAVGTSIGANILVKYLGEEGSKTLLGGAIAICSPWDLVICDRFITRKWVQGIYNKALTMGLCQYAELHQAVFSRMIDWSLLSASKSVRDFDHHCTRHVGRYETVDTYYRKCSSAQFVESVRVPLLCVNAEDDPVCTKEAIPYDECRVNPNVILALTKHGGHLGFFEGLGANSLWYVRALNEFSKVLLSSSLLHKQNEGIEPSRTKAGPGIDQGPFLALGDDCTVIAGADDSNAVFEGQAETSDLRQERSVNELDPLIGPQLIKDKSGHLAEDGSYVIVGDDFGGPLYKHEEALEGRDNDNALEGHEETKEDEHRSGQATVKLQIRSFSELMALQSVLSQLLQQLRQQSCGFQEPLRDSKKTLEISGQKRTLSEPAPVSRFSRLTYGSSSKEDKENPAPKTSPRTFSKKFAAREKVGSAPSQPQDPKKDLANHIASQNRRTFWLLAYIALITTFPFLGSALMVRARGKIFQVLSRHWGKYKA